MDSSFLCLVAGFLAGTLASGLLLFWISNQSKKKQDASLEKRNQVIRSIAEIFTDIDSLVTSFRTDLLSEDKFRSSLYSKLDAANKIYKPNMHLLDLYYVKFTDMQFAKYHQLTHGKLTNLQLDGQMAFDNEIASIEKSSDLIHSTSSDQSNSQSPAAFFADSPVNGSSEVFRQTKKEELTVTGDVCAIDDECKDDQIPDFEFVSMEPDDNQVVVDEQQTVKNNEQPVVADEQPVIVNDEQPVLADEQPVTVNDEQPVLADEQPVIVNDEQPVLADEQPVIVNDEQPVLADEQPVIVNDEQPVVADEQPVIVNDEQPVLVDEQPVIVNDEQPVMMDDEQPAIADEQPAILDEEPEVIAEELPAVEDSKVAEDLDDEIVFEVNPDKAADKKGSPFISNTTIEVSKNSIDSFVDESAQEQKSDFQKEFEQVAKEPQDEEMLETIMDLDMGKLLRTGSINIENIDKNALPPKYAASGRGTDESVEKVEQVKDSLAEEPQKAIQSAKEKEDQEKIVIARGDDGSLDTILDEEPADAELNNKSGDVNDVSITGDDVASKIDSFFGIK